MPTADEIITARLRLAPLEQAVLKAAANRRRTAFDPGRSFQIPGWWPDEADRGHVLHWLAQASGPQPPPAAWGPLAVVRETQMIGHAGFHGPPVALAVALDDPSYRGSTSPASPGTVEIGYTIFPDHRDQGYALEAASGLVDFATASGLVSTVLATVLPDNQASLAVLAKLGGFIKIGVCIADEGEEDVYRRDLQPIRR